MIHKGSLANLSSMDYEMQIKYWVPKSSKTASGSILENTMLLTDVMKLGVFHSTTSRFAVSTLRKEIKFCSKEAINMGNTR